MLGSKWDLKMHVRYLGHPLSIKIVGTKTTYFGRLGNLKTNLTAYFFRRNRIYIIGVEN